jgi:hypothetical protein
MRSLYLLVEHIGQSLRFDLRYRQCGGTLVCVRAKEIHPLQFLAEFFLVLFGLVVVGDDGMCFNPFQPVTGAD